MITNIGLSPRNIGNIAVIGGGLIGSGIATVLVLNNFHVVLKEETEASLQNGIGRVKGEVKPILPFLYWVSLIER